MVAIFMISRNSRTSESRRLMLNISEKINLRKSDIYVAL